MGDDHPQPEETHTVTIEIQPKQWTPAEWAQFKAALKQAIQKYGGKIKVITYEKHQ